MVFGLSSSSTGSDRPEAPRPGRGLLWGPADGGRDPVSFLIRNLPHSLAGDAPQHTPFSSSVSALREQQECPGRFGASAAASDGSWGFPGPRLSLKVASSTSRSMSGNDIKKMKHNRHRLVLRQNRLFIHPRQPQTPGAHANPRNQNRRILHVSSTNYKQFKGKTARDTRGKEVTAPASRAVDGKTSWVPAPCVDRNTSIRRTAAQLTWPAVAGT
ncbi:uncharacterized protein LOC123934272 isoform X2 [Meles meles]|uniref:uncharacterized protein LOC123934272 isoform X2 n=1 Tax=Meles meles TaxID=9662 RepID=UPI001E69F303|nr:uncharacterized protein LOC123934272 isoform X2 [Meles meles]